MDAQAWDARYAAARQWSVEPNGFVADRLGDLSPGRGLDLACGEGRNALWLARLGWQMTALDFSAVALQRGREAATGLGEDVAARVEWVVGKQPVHQHAHRGQRTAQLVRGRRNEVRLQARQTQMTTERSGRHDADDGDHADAGQCHRYVDRTMLPVVLVELG